MAGWIIFLVFWLAGVFLERSWKLRRLVMMSSSLPGPLSLPIIGTAYLFIFSSDYAHRMWELGKKYGPLQRFWLGSKLLVGLSDPQHLQIALKSKATIEKDDMYRFFKERTDSVFIANGRRWEELRRLLTPQFSTKTLEKNQEVFNSCAKILVEQLREAAKYQTPVDIYPYVARCTLDIICRTAMGVEMEVQTKDYPDFAEAVARSSEIVLMRFSKPWLHPDFIFNLTKYKKEMEVHCSTIHYFAYQVLARRRALLKMEDEAKLQADAMGIHYESQLMKADYLDRLLASKLDGITDTDKSLVHHITDVLLGGMDTVAAGASFALLAAGMQAGVGEGLRAEAATLHPSKTLHSLPYLNAVLCESLRHTATPGIVRRLSADIRLGDHWLPAGCSVYIGLQYNHKREDLWGHNVNSFCPELFSSSVSSSRPPLSYLPFASGPRACPGQSYGMRAMKTIVFWIVRDLGLKSELAWSELKFKTLLMTEPKQGYRLLLTPHNRSSRAG